MQSITATLLKQILDENPGQLTLVDVRESDEHAQFNIGGTLIPLPEIGEKHHLIARDRPVVLYCRKGVRSMIAIQRLEDKYGFTNLINLSGGMDGWIRENGLS
jgi:adenylyltransferase/sulfurtransferase